MSGIKVHCEVRVLEVNGKAVDSNAKTKQTIVVESDWRTDNNRASANPQITLTLGETKYTVFARDLLTAAKHASET